MHMSHQGHDSCSSTSSAIHHTFFHSSRTVEVAHGLLPGPHGVTAAVRLPSSHVLLLLLPGPCSACHSCMACSAAAAATSSIAVTAASS